MKTTMHNPHNEIAQALELHFEDSFVVQEYQQYKTVIDFAVIAKDWMFEVEQVAVKDEIKIQLAKLANRGREQFKKHQVLQHGFKGGGRMATNCFYFLAPATSKIQAEDIPDKYGLLTYRLKRSGEVEITCVREATFLHEEYLTRNFYRTMADTLARRMKALLK